LFRLQPYAAQAAANGFRYRKRVVFANRAPRELSRYAVELTEEWDHAAEVTATRSDSTGKDVRVFVDGVEVDRWDGEHANNDWNSTATKIWINGNWQAARTVTVATAMTATSPLNGEEQEVDGIAGMPESGRVLIGDELIHYQGVTPRNANGKAALQNVIRGYHGTTAATHSVADVGYVEEHEIWVYYGWTGAPTYTERTDTKPLLDLSLSTLTNIVHSWTQFSDSRYPARSMGWTRRLVTRDDQSDRIVAADGAPLAAMGLAYYANGAQAGKPAFNQWSRAIPCGVDDASNALSYVATQDSDMAHQVVAADADGNETRLTTKVGTLSSAAVNITPTANLYAVRFWSFNPKLWSYATTSTTFNGATLTGATADNAQRITVGDEPIIVSSVLAKVTDDSSSRTLTCRIHPDQSTGPSSSVIATSATAATGGAGTEETLEFVFSTPPTLAAGSTYWVAFSSAAGSPIVRAVHPAHGSSATYISGTLASPAVLDLAITVQGYRGAVAQTLDRLDTNGTPTDGHSSSIESVTVTMDSALIPYVAFLAREDAAYLDGTLRNVTTGQSLRLRTPLSPLAKLEVDVAARAVRNLAECPYALTLSGNEITDLVRLAATSGDGRTVPDGSVGIWPAATNIVTNGGFETNDTGWSGAGGAPPTQTRTAATDLFGSYVLRVDCNGSANQGVMWNNPPSGATGTVVPGTTYTAALDVIRRSGSGTIQLRIAWFTAGGALISTSDGSEFAIPATRTRVTLTATAPALAERAAVIFNRASGATGTVTFDLDGVQLEASPVATPYVETNGGTATRAAARVRLPVHDLFSEEQGWVAVRLRAGFASASGTGDNVHLFELGNTPSVNDLLLLDGTGNFNWRMRRGTTAAGVTSATQAGSFTRGGSETVIGSWTATALAISADGAAATSAAQSAIP
ncbi:MAG: hypothetical protein AB7G21_15145, partial [Dehalococcoidia bacterium]